MLRRAERPVGVAALSWKFHFLSWELSGDSQSRGMPPRVTGTTRILHSSSATFNFDLSADDPFKRKTNEGIVVCDVSRSNTKMHFLARYPLQSRIRVTDY